MIKEKNICFDFTHMTKVKNKMLLQFTKIINILKGPNFGEDRFRY